LALAAGESCYLHGGAYLVGKIGLGPEGASNTGPIRSNISLTGHGVVDSLGVSTGTGPGRPTRVNQVQGGTIKGPTFLNETHWAAIITESDDVLVEDVLMLSLGSGTPGTPDGIDIIGSSNVTYRRCLIRSKDDGIAVKTYKNGFGNAPFWRGNVENILVEDCVFDQGDGGNGLEVGYENLNNTTDGTTPVIDPVTGTQVDHITGVTFRRCDIVRKTRDPAIIYRMAGLGIHLVDDVALTSVLYEDVNLEYVDGQFWIWFGSFASSDYSYASGRAQISDITLRRVVFNGPTSLPIHLQGGGGGLTIDGLTFEDVSIKGRTLTDSNPVAGKVTWEITDTTGMVFA
jgi:hypothetical protein